MQPLANISSPDKTTTAPVVVRDEVVEGVVVRWLTLNRPDVMNPLDATTVSALHDEVVRANADRVRVIVITGTGEAFSAGGDLKAYTRLYDDPAAFRHFLDTFGELCDLLETGPAASISMINGTCVAGGLELALSTDVVIISEEARIGDGHLKFAQLPGAGGSQRLVRAVGPQRAKTWLLSGRLFDACEAVELGVAAEAVPANDLRAATLRWATQIGAHSPLAVAKMKELVRHALELPLSEGLERERQLVADYTTSHDAREGLAAFADRRPARYQGR